MRAPALVGVFVLYEQKMSTPPPFKENIYVFKTKKTRVEDRNEMWAVGANRSIFVTSHSCTLTAGSARGRKRVSRTRVLPVVTFTERRKY